MKYLEIKRGDSPRTPQNKMQPGTRSDQMAPLRADLVKFAASLNVDVSAVQGTGAGGAITKADIQAAADAKAMF